MELNQMELNIDIFKVYSKLFGSNLNIIQQNPKEIIKKKMMIYI